MSLKSNGRIIPHLPLLTCSILIALSSGQFAAAACDNHQPGNNQTILCNADAPNPDTTPVASPNGTAGVTMNIAEDSALNIAGSPAISLGDGSRVTNAGSVSGGSSGMTFREGNNVLNNSGDISATSGPGVVFSGSGNNQLNNSGTIRASGGTAVNFGSGNDSLLMTDGTIEGDINQGDGADRAEIRAGTITGELSQGNGIDDFLMTGGTLGSLAQGDNRDTFTMTGGTITGAFVDGDEARMSGGTIGRVDMKLDNNLFDMSGGRIIGNLVTGFGNDTIILSDGSIGGNISVSGGADSVTITGGTVGGEIRMSNGNDRFLWENGGRIEGAILLGADEDNAVLRHLSADTVASTPALDGGEGTDTLQLDDSQVNDPARLTNWETVSLNNGSSLNMDSTLTLGDGTTQTGTVNIDASSQLLAGGLDGATIAPNDSSSRVNVNNAGTIDLTNGNNSTADSLTIEGNYVGQNAILKLQTQLGDENSPSDRLIVSNGEASGDTQIQLTNVNGTGAYVNGNGIELVSAINSATTTPEAFNLQGGSISAGAYEYVLFRGGATADSENNWYLRNTLIAPPPVDPTEPPTDPTDPTDPTEPPTDPNEPQPPVEPAGPTPAPGSPTLPHAAPGADPVPLYRQEAPLYSALPPVMFQMGLTALGTFHERQGGQWQLTGKGDYPASWARVFGIHKNQHWSGAVSPSFDGSFSGFQVGQDLYAREYDNGQRDHAGLFYSYTRADGDVDGFVLGFNNAHAGKLKMNGNSAGGYWTHLWSNQSYLDAVFMYTWLDGTLRSGRGIGHDTQGKLLTGSLEAGYPIPLSERWSLEPQAQVVAQHLSMDDINDGISNVSWDSETVYSGRLGARLLGTYGSADRPVQPYLKANIWHDFKHTGAVNLDQDTLNVKYQNTSMELGLGVTATVSDSVNLYAAASQTSGLDSNHQRDYSGNLGVRINW